MSRKWSEVGLAIVVLLGTATTALAQFPEEQKNEAGGLIGRSFIAGHAITGTLLPPLTFNRINFGKPISFQGTYARRIKVSDLVAYVFEAPVTYQRDVDLLSSNDNVPADYNALFITPGIRVHLFPNTLISPWVAAGGGFGRFTASKHGVFNVLTLPGHSKTTSVIDFGFGLDVRIRRNWKLRAEMRDFYSGVPDLNVNQGRTRFHNVWIGGGVVIPF